MSVNADIKLNNHQQQEEKKKKAMASWPWQIY
jgi:hypothetical protein